MKAAAQVGGPVGPVYSNTILASQRYRVQSSGTGIEFDPNDPLNPYVSNAMRATLAFAQLDSGVAQFLSDGLKYAYAHSNGWNFPAINSISVLANFTYPGPTTAHIPDATSTNNSHTATATGKATGCGISTVTISETVQDSYSFSPLFSQGITNPGGPVGGGWLSKPPAAFTGSSPLPTTPFNGPSSSGNPYLIVSVQGSAVNWATYNFAPVDCWNNPNFACSGTIQIDPVPYAEPGAYYDTSGNLVGTEANPFTIIATLYAIADHESQWATRTINGVQEWGTFTTPVTLFGITLYKYVKVM
jgi:hypothetical protein